MVNHESRPLGKTTRNQYSYRSLTHENSFKTLMKLLANRLTKQVENMLLDVQFSLQMSTMIIHTVKFYTILAYVQAFNFQNGHNLITKLVRPTECEHHDNKNTVALNTAKIIA
jgi:hypothetical protein